MRTLLLLPALLLVACGGDDEADTGDHEHHDTDTDTDTDAAEDTDTDTAPVGDCGPEHTLQSAVLDTSGDWVYYDLDTAAVVTEADGWDLRMQTWIVETNGGVTGDGGVEVTVLDGARDAFEDHCAAPASGFAADTAAGEAFGAWYDYDVTTHEVSPADRIYFVRTTDGAYHRLRFDGYYEDAGAVHTPGLTHGVVDAP